MGWFVFVIDGESPRRSMVYVRSEKVALMPPTPSCRELCCIDAVRQAVSVGAKCIFINRPWPQRMGGKSATPLSVYSEVLPHAAMLRSWLAAATWECREVFLAYNCCCCCCWRFPSGGTVPCPFHDTLHRSSSCVRVPAFLSQRYGIGCMEIRALANLPTPK